MDSPASTARNRETRVRLAAVAVALVVGLGHLPALDAGFVNWDDPIYVERAPLGRALAAAFTTLHASGNWHPLATLSHAVDHALWGLYPAGHHLTSIVLHGLVAALVVVLVGRLLRLRETRAQPGALLVATLTGLLWGLHPLRVEAVAWISERKELVCALFYLLGVLAYLRYAVAPRWGWYAGALACGGLALLAKPMATSLPLVLLVLDAYPLRRLRRPGLGRALAEKLPFAALAAASALLTLHAQHAAGAMGALAQVPPLYRAAVAQAAVVAYLGKTLLPSGLHALYAYPRPGELAPWQIALPLLVLVLLVLAAARSVRRWGGFSAALASYVVLLLPVIGIVQVGPQAMADRYTYLPGIPLALLLAAAFAALREHLAPPAQRWSALPLLAFLLGLAALTFHQIAVWRNSETLWSQALAHQPANTEAHNSRADYYYRHGRFHDALADYTAALASLPAWGPVHAQKRRAAIFNDRAVTWVQLGKLTRAIADESEAIRLAPHRPDYHANRARMLGRLGLSAEAQADEERARALREARPRQDPPRAVPRQ
jgi:tetratricopeptide (TPR) repeat protein